MNPFIGPIDNQDCASIILHKTAHEDSFELLKNRLVNTTWKDYSDNLIEIFWDDLRRVDPKGPVNIYLAMDGIDKQAATHTPAILKFAKLMDVFKNQGCTLANASPRLVMIKDFRKLQHEHELALKQIWPRLIQLPQLSRLEGLPGLDAGPAEIRSFLHNNKNVLETIPQLNLNDLELKLLPPELKLFKGLQTLNLRNNQLSDISCLSALTKLTALFLDNNQLSDVSCLRALTKLTVLWLRNNQLSDISCLRTLTNLTVLWLRNNQLSDISSLRALTNLTLLALDNNQISDISCLSALINLEHLSLNNNQLSDISYLKALSNLEVLKLNNNLLTKIPDLPNLKSLFTFEIAGNPLIEAPASNGGLSSNGKRTYETAFGVNQSS